MNTAISNLKAVIVAVMLTTAMLFYWYGDILSNPQQPLGNSQDAFKNYYTIQYHVLHDSSAWHFEGMNYPLGEHVVFTDNQPLLANSLKLINSVLPIGNELVSIINLLMLISLVVCAMLLALILRAFDIGWVYAGVAAALIAMLSPQIIRLPGHFALAYTFFIPLLWYLWLLYLNRSNQTLSIAIGAVLLAFSFIHVYYLALGLFFGFALWLCSFLSGMKITGRSLLNLFIQFILPFILFQLWMMLTDTISDRPSQPFGFLEYRARWESVFLPANLPLGTLISEHIAGIRPIGYESRAYAGLAVTLFILLLIGIVLARLFNRKAAALLKFERPLTVSFLAGLLILIFSLGIPFIFGLEELVQYLGPLQQFRSIGRFAWIFFYTANITAFVWYFRQWRSGRRLYYKLMVLLVPFGFLVADVIMFNNDVRSLPITTQVFEVDTEMINPNDYQALVPLPYYHLGSETPGVAIRCNVMNPSMQVSLQTGLPLTAVNLSRTSLSQTAAQKALLQQRTIAKDILALYTSNKPLLLMVENCQLSSIEKDWISKAKYISSSAGYEFYRLPMDSVRHTILN